MEFQSENKLECEFRQIPTSGIEGVKSGRYSQSMHWEIPEFGTSKWVVLGYIDIDWPKLKDEHYLSETDIIERCLNHLNETPVRKKFQKKQPVPKFGKLEPYKADFKISKNPYIIVQFLTDDHSNENFWSEGPVLFGVKVKKKKKEVDPDQTELD